MPKGVPIKYSSEEEKKQCKRDYNNNRYCPIKNKDNKLKKAYGISLEEYNKMFDEQNGCCAICGDHQSSMTRSLSVDHCHKTGTIRGLLCKNCNTSLGQFKDSIELLLKAIEYLRK
jgi:hypothetical protein